MFNELKTLNNEEKQPLLDYLYQNDPVKNMFIIFDIQTFGLNEEGFATYVTKNGNKFENVFYVYHNNLVIFHKNNNIDPESFFQILEKYQIKNIITASSDVQFFTNIIHKFKRGTKLFQENIASLDVDYFYDKISLEDNPARIFAKEDIPSIIESRKQIKEFEGFASQNLDKNFLEGAFDKDAYWGFVIEKDNKIASHASISAYTDKTVMIGGVFTLSEYRNQKLATKCLVKLCDYIIKQRGKIPVLFYENPIAGEVYQKLGFKVNGTLTVIHIERGEK
ncbi:GNAT family N-acetyltransferase [Mycoplasmopsis gallinacea]|uniref:GNAT family N-acetyltransferase n=1 Tax=Mycoplasmopsis gallinacea TaxID=29556 RepID=A0A6H0V276_9BACT|nr:GNAT family N-acetyltransferase [Mycoplasmopsis gallinacea]QIW62302.1 GNAT family N-acetyltransferase [Mycoplasmopsis gallinacea]